MIDESYEKELEGLASFRPKMDSYSSAILFFWVALFLGFIIWWFLKEQMPDQVTGFSLQSLNLMGGTFNVVIGLTGVTTVWLLSKAVSFQKEELIKIQKQMTSQRTTIEKEEKVNRTIDLVHKWTSLDEYIGEPYTRGTSIDPTPKERSNYLGVKQTAFIKHLMLIEESRGEYKNKIDFDVICKSILNDGAKRGIEDKISYIKIDALKLSQSDYSKYDDWSVEQIESLPEDEEIKKYFLKEIDKDRKAIAFLEKYE